MTITRINEFTAADGKADELYNFLNSLAPFINGSEGCELYQVLRSEEEDGCFVVLEQWQSITHHQQALARYPKEDMQAARPLFGAPPKGRYFRR